MHCYEAQKVHTLSPGVTAICTVSFRKIGIWAKAGFILGECFPSGYEIQLRVRRCSVVNGKRTVGACMRRAADVHIPQQTPIERRNRELLETPAKILH